MRRALTVAVGLLTLLGCSVGSRVARFSPAQGPHGVEVEASLLASSPAGARTDVTGELIELRTDGLLVLGTLVEVRRVGRRQVPMRRLDAKPQFVLVPFDKILEAHFVGLGSCCTLRDGRAPSDTVQERLRFVSRFPQGLAPELLQRLLEAQGQAEVRRLEP